MRKSRNFRSVKPFKIRPADLFNVYRKLRRTFGHQAWWPGDTPFEVAVGAILTQNTAWTNVEKAILNLKRAGKLSFAAMRPLAAGELSKLIRPAGYYNVKADRLKHFLQFLETECEGDIRKMCREKTLGLRKKLLNVKGIGRETADSILLYALGKRSFVIDAYTKRIFSRHRLMQEDGDYDDWKAVFEKALPRRVGLYNDFHAQIVRLAKEFCGTAARCHNCPLRQGINLPKDAKLF
ncbi:MAG: endonuclease III [Candidatus Omnitrophica bacterium ADurb.Bin277]|nr:MAG: endonuclease III [Candidatus Omnitrophica bacterium ADurb.Bin277]